MLGALYDYAAYLSESVVDLNSEGTGKVNLLDVKCIQLDVNALYFRLDGLYFTYSLYQF